MKRIAMLTLVGLAAILASSVATSADSKDTKVLVEAKAYTDAQVSVETTARQSADAAEASQRSAADNQEASIRIKVDNVLTSMIETEASDRASADTSLQAAIGAEASAREAADAKGINEQCGTVDVPGKTATAPEPVGTVAWLGSTSRSGTLPAGGTGERWFAVSFLNNGDNFHPHVYLSSGAAYYVLDVFLTTNGNRACPTATQPTQASFGVNNWEVHPPGTDAVCPSQQHPAPGATMFVRVRPVSINSTCQSFTLVFVNG
jgi:hypothetical protein